MKADRVMLHHIIAFFLIKFSRYFFFILIILKISQPGICFSETALKLTRIPTFANPYNKINSYKSSKIINLKGISSETIYLSLLIHNTKEFNINDLVIKLINSSSIVPSDLSYEYYLVQPWYQYIRPITRSFENTISMDLVPELLLKNDIHFLKDGDFSSNINENFQGDILTFVPKRDFRYLCLKFNLPNVKKTTTLKFNLVAEWNEKTISDWPISIVVFPFNLPESKKIKAIYFLNEMDNKSEAHYYDSIKKQLIDIYAHGFRSIVIKGKVLDEILKLTNIANEHGVAENVILIYIGKSDESLKRIYKCIDEIVK